VVTTSPKSADNKKKNRDVDLEALKQMVYSLET